LIVPGRNRAEKRKRQGFVDFGRSEDESGKVSSWYKNAVVASALHVSPGKRIDDGFVKTVARRRRRTESWKAGDAGCPRALGLVAGRVATAIGHLPGQRWVVPGKLLLGKSGGVFVRRSG